MALAGVYAGLGAYFIAAIQVIVYAGAIMVLFMFAIMVLESRRERPRRLPSFRLHRLGALVAGGVLLVALAGVTHRYGFQAGSLHEYAPSLSAQAKLLFSVYLLPFELVGLLLLIALVAVMVLTQRAFPSSDSS